MKTYFATLFLWTCMVVFTNYGLAMDGYCQYKKWSKPGSLVFKVIAGIHEKGTTGLCSEDMSKLVLDHIIALDWITDILNGVRDSSEPFLDGHSIGYEVYDNCNNADVTTDILLTESPFCSVEVTNNTNSTMTIGTIALSNIETSAVIARLEHNTLVLRPLPSSPEMNKNINQAMFSTVVQFQRQLMATIKLLEHLQWNYVIEIHSDDEYGLQASAAFKLATKSRGICTAYSGFPNNFKEIYKIARTQVIDKSVAVLFFGEPDAFINMLLSIGPRPNDIQINWILPYNIPTEMFLSNITTYESVFMVNYDYTDKEHLDAENIAWVTFRLSVLSQNGQLQTGSVIAELISDLYSNSKPNTLLEKSAYDPKHMIDIVISTVVVASRVCGRDLAKCKGMNASTRTTIIDKMKISEINVTEHFKSITFYPYTTEIISFDPDGYQKYNDLRVEVYNGTTGDMSVPWVYTAEGKFEKLLRAEGGYLPSNCLETCEQCFNIDDIRYSYLPGDIIILGLFSIRAHGKTAFTCGEKDQANDIITVSAFMHSVQEKRNVSGIPFGALAIDDCYNGMNITIFLFDLFNKRVFITDPATNAIIDMDKVVAIIGPVSSPVALVVGDFAKSISLPIVSYGASSPDLDNKLRYQYLLRTVPSDPLQVRGMVDMLEYLNTTHVGLLYYDDAYGINGKEGLLNEAKIKNICIREPMKLTPYMKENELAKIITNIFQMELRVVLFFGTDTVAKRLLVELKKHTNPKPLIFIASDGWGTNIELVDKDLSKKSVGSIVFTVSSKAYMNTTYRQLLEQLNITQTQYNRWIPNYFEKINRCVLRNSFEKSSIPICNEINMSKNLSGELVNSLISDQRAVHARLAVLAVTEGFKRFCGSIACAPTVRNNTVRFIDEIKAVTVNSDRLFDEHGNGNIGFTIYNIQLTDSGHAFYKEVGQYGTDRKLKITNPLRFYDTLGNNVSLNSSVEFRSYINCFNYVVNNGACSQTCGEKTTQLPPVTIPVNIMTTSANENGEDNAYRIALIALSAAFGVFVLVFLVVTILLFRWMKHKPNSLSSGTTGSASGKSDLDTMYHISGSGYMTTFDNAGFDVNSLHSHPQTPTSTRDTRIIPNGRANSVSSFGSGPVQYSDIRMLRQLGAVGHHIRQRSNIEMHKIHLDSFERPSSVLSVPVGNSYTLKTSSGMRKYKRQDLANLGKHSSNSHLIGPSSAPANHQQSRPRAASSPRFRYPSDDEHYVLPSDMQRSAHTRRLAVSEDDLFCASSNNPDNAEPVQYHSSCFTSGFGDENAAVDKNESHLNYATLMAKDSEGGDDVDANEFNAHMSHNSGSLSEIVFEDMDCVNGNLAELNNGCYGGRKQSSRKGSLVISPSEKEVMKINFPDDDITSVLVQDHAKPKTDNRFLKINNRTPSGNSTLPGPRSSKGTMEYLSSLQNVPDIIKLEHYPCDDSDGDGLVFTI